jgi:predicted helicase
MPVHSTGVKSHRDHFVFDFDDAELYKRIENFKNLSLSDQEIIEKYEISDSRDWKISERRKSLAANPDWKKYFTKCLYRPFDQRAYFHHQDVVELPRNEVTRNFLKTNNLGFITSRNVEVERVYDQVLCTSNIIDNHTLSLKEANYIFPLYIYPDTESKQKSIFTSNKIETNISQKFINLIQEKLGYIPTPEEIFYYIYAIFYSPTYRDRYAEFLKIDFPRVPFTSDKQLFQNLSSQGQVLVDLHLMKSKKLNKLITKMGGKGDNAVTEVTYKLIEKRIYINKEQYFEGIEQEVWEFKIGGYQVLDKWLKDRKKAKRSLSFDDILHYQKVIVTLKETMEIMQEIDRIIPSFPIE